MNAAEHMRTDAILLCGGKGKRLRALTDDLMPKSLFAVAGKELIRYSLELMDARRVSALIFAVDYKAAQMQQWAEQLVLTDYLVRFSNQVEPGVLGALLAALRFATQDVVVECNTDEIRMGFSFADVLEHHQRFGTLATVVAAYTNHLSRHRVLYQREKDNLVTKTVLKPEAYLHKPEHYGLVNTGLIVMHQRAMEFADLAYNHDWGGLIDPLCQAGELSAYVPEHAVYFNVGTPDEYREAEMFINGRQVQGHQEYFGYPQADAVREPVLAEYTREDQCRNGGR